MRAGPQLDDIVGWNEIKPLIDYGKNGRLNVRGVKLFMDGKILSMLTLLMLTIYRCFGILGSRYVGIIFG